MSTMTHDRLRVEGPLEFQSVTMLTLSVQGNAHGRMAIKGYIDPDRGLGQLHKDFKGTPVTVYGADEGSDKLRPIFAGKFEQVILHAEGGQVIAEGVALTCTAELDRQKKSRSFQDTGMTYADVIWSVLGDTPKAGANFAAGEDTAIGRPLIQYEETDWEFIKRLASELRVQLFANCTVSAPQFDVGLAGYQFDHKFSAPDYICKLDERFYLLGGSQTGQYKPDFLCYIVEDGHSLRVGSSVQWQQAPLFICEKTAELRKGELVFTYTLGRRGLTGVRPYQNKKLTGLALGGTVRSTKGEQVTLTLDIDGGRNAGSYLFPWRPESGNLMYCMPKVGTRAMLYLQDSDAGSAIVLNSPRENGQSCGAMGDTSKRCFTTEHGKQLFLYPDSMGIKAGAPDAPVQVKLDKESGLVMESAQGVQMIARQGVFISAPTVGVSSPQQLLIQQTGAATEKSAQIVPKGTADTTRAIANTTQVITAVSETAVAKTAAPNSTKLYAQNTGNNGGNPVDSYVSLNKIIEEYSFVSRTNIYSSISTTSSEKRSWLEGLAKNYYTYAPYYMSFDEFMYI